MRIVVSGGAGFLGSHLCEHLVSRGDEVVCVDDLSSGRLPNIEGLLAADGFEFVEADVRSVLEVRGHVDAVAHLASAASPPDYLARPLHTLTTGSAGTLHALELAEAHRARFVLTSTSEVYGDPLVHPQSEDYWGNVNPVGPRSVYDEAKRYAEALTTAHRNARGTNTGIMRIFNTFGPRMRSDDGRVISNFVTQALAGRPLTVYGDGHQTRSFCYVDDLIRGVVAMLDSSEPGPINFGNPTEHTVLDVAERIISMTGSPSRIERRPLPIDDPTRRQPVITRASDLFGWSPRVPFHTGLERTIEWFSTRGAGDMDAVAPAAG